MPIQLSSYLWLRNNDLMPIVEGRPNNDTARYMTPQERHALKKVIDEIDELHRDSTTTISAEGIVGPNVLIRPGFPVIVEKSHDPRRTGELFHEIHKILKDHSVNVSIYRGLGRAFAELGVEDIDPELKIAIKYGTRNFEVRARGFYDPDTRATMCAGVVIDQELRRQSGSKEKI